MTRTTSARIAGSMFLLYIVVGIASMVLFGRATRSAEGAAARLAAIAQNAGAVRLTVLLDLSTFFIAVALGVALYALTRDENRELAMMALLFRAGEGVVGAVACVRTLGLVSLATQGSSATGPDIAAATALGDLLLKQGGLSMLIGATCFAVGSTLFAYLFLRARSIPVSLAWLGVFASGLLVVALPLRLMELLRRPAESLVWLPMLVFEVTLALWLLVKGVAVPGERG